jgi:hypothetical protein
MRPFCPERSSPCRLFSSPGCEDGFRDGEPSSDRYAQRTSLTLAELIRPFLAMFSMSSTLVEPLDLQAMIVEASQRRDQGHRSPRSVASDAIIHSLRKVTCGSPCLPLSHLRYFLVSCLLRYHRRPASRSIPTHGRRPADPPKIPTTGSPSPDTPSRGLFEVRLQLQFPQGKPPIFVASLVLARAGVFIQTWLCSPGRFRTSLPC